MKNVTQTHYAIKSAHHNGTYSQDGYSKYNERWKMERDGKLPEGEEVYGYEQALTHIEEIRNSVYEGKQQWKNDKFEVVIVTTVQTFIPIEYVPID